MPGGAKGADKKGVKGKGKAAQGDDESDELQPPTPLEVKVTLSLRIWKTIDEMIKETRKILDRNTSNQPA